MIKPRLALALLAIATLALPSASSRAAAEATSPHLVYHANDGQTYPISGQQYVLGKARPYYFKPQGAKTFIPSLEGISIEGERPTIDPFAILADNYITTVKRNQDTPYLTLHKLDFTETLLKNATVPVEGNDTFVIVWIQKNATTPLYLSRFTSNLTVVNLTDIAVLTPEGEYTGYPALLLFRDGQALLPADPSVTIQRFAKENVSDHDLFSAALNGFADYLAENLPARDKESDPLYRQLLALALQTGRTHAVDLLVKRIVASPQKIDRRINEHELLPALNNGHLAAALALLSHLELDVITKNISSHLVETAILNQQFEVADALLKFGYKLSIPKERRPKALLSCLVSNRIDYIEKLYPKKRPKPSDFLAPGTSTIFHQVAATATPDTLDYLLQFDIPIDREDSDQFTPLIKAAGYGNIPAVCWFLDNGARIDHRNAAGHTALQYSIVTQQAEATACLLQQGSDINMLGPEGVTPLMQAALFRDLDAAASIAQAGGIWNLDSSYLDHCLVYTLQQDLAPILQIAIQQGLSPQYRAYGKWPLDWLTLYYGSPACRAMLDPANNLALHSQAAPSPQITLKHFDRADLNEILNSAKLPDTVTFTCLLPTPSTPNLVWLNTPVERFLENDIRTLITHFKFQLPTPTQSNEEAPLLILTAELNFQDRPTNLTDALTILNLSQIPNPQ